MIGSTRQVTVWAYGGPAVLRKGFDGLSALVSQGLRQDPLSGDCYLFVNATRKRLKRHGHQDGGGHVEQLEGRTDPTRGE